MELHTGMTGRADAVVTEANTAMTMGSGSLPVFATPAMTALMEKAACAAIAAGLTPEESSVGICLDITHDSPTPPGMKVWAESELTQVEKRILTFQVQAYDETGLIGQGTHQRCIIGVEKFMAKCAAKKGD